MLDGGADIGLGFKYDPLVEQFGRDRVAALPNWLIYERLVQLSTCKLKGASLISRWNAGNWRMRPHFSVFLARKDAWPRGIMVTAAATVSRVLCPGRAFHNVDMRKLIAPGVDPMSKDAKLRLLRETRYTVTAENSLGHGYWSEKLWDAHAAGAVPLYWGSAPPQPQVWNPARILMYDPVGDADGVALAARIRTLEGSRAAQDAFFAQPVLQPGAERWVEDRCIDIARVFEAGMWRKLGHLLAAAGIKKPPPVQPKH
jgi:hypothetical protein